MQALNPAPTTTRTAIADGTHTRSPALDGLRAVAVLMVVALHVGFLMHPPVVGLAKTYFPGGFAGVDVFFVLSGFLITWLLLHERQRHGRISIKRFYARRALRLLPALVALLVVQALYALKQGMPVFSEFKVLAAVLLYASNFVQAFHLHMPPELSHTWSLAVEEQFYLVWPAALTYLLIRRVRDGKPPRISVPAILTVALVATNVARIIDWHAQGYPAAYMLPYCHADGLIIGAMLAFAHHAGRAPKRGAAAAGWAGLVFLLVFLVVWPEGKAGNVIYYGGFTVLALASAAVLNAVLVAPGRLSRVLSWRPLVGIGRVSYGLYLWHVLLFTVLTENTLGLGRWTRAFLGLALSAAATLASWILVEQPALRVKERYSADAPARTTAPRTQPRRTGAVVGLTGAWTTALAGVAAAAVTALVVVNGHSAPTLQPAAAAHGSGPGASVNAASGNPAPRGSGHIIGGGAKHDAHGNTATSSHRTTPAGRPHVPAATTAPTAISALISRVLPDAGPLKGGTTVTLIGRQLNHLTGVTFGGIPALGFKVDSPRRVTAVAPSHAGAAGVRVSITVPASVKCAGSCGVTYHYLPLPTITGLSPATGPVSGGRQVVIHGTGFVPHASVRFGNTVLRHVTWLSPTSLGVTTPPARVAAPSATGTLEGLRVAVQVSTPGGNSTERALSMFTYL